MSVPGEPPLKRHVPPNADEDEPPGTCGLNEKPTPSAASPYWLVAVTNTVVVGGHCGIPEKRRHSDRFTVKGSVFAAFTERSGAESWSPAAVDARLGSDVEYADAG